MGRSGLAGSRFPPDVIAVAVRWYPATACPTGTSRNRSPSTTRGRSRHSLSVSEPVDSAIHGRRPAPPALHSRPMVRRRDDVIMSGRWRYLYRAVDQFGQVIDVLLSPGVMSQLSVASSSKRWREGSPPAAVTTDRAAVNSRVFDELVPDTGHVVERHASNSVEADHGRLEASAASDPRTETVPQTPSLSPGTPSHRTCADTTNPALVTQPVAGSQTRPSRSLRGSESEAAEPLHAPPLREHNSVGPTARSVLLRWPRQPRASSTARFWPICPVLEVIS